MTYKEIIPDFWKPEAAEDSIEGIYIACDEKVGTNNSNVYILENDGKQIKVWGSTIIDDRMRLISPGDKVKIIFKGETKNKKGQALKLFSVFKDTPDKIEIKSIGE